MFLAKVVAVYSLPAIYSYFRVRKLFIKTVHKVLFTLFYIFLFLGFPLAELLSHQPYAEDLLFLILPCYYSLPFLLYLFLLVLLLDVLRGINRLLKLLPVETLWGRQFRVAALWLLFSFSAAIVAFGAVHLNTLRVNEYQVAIPRKAARINHLKIAMAADFHLGLITPKRFLKRFTQEINRLQPDILLLPGDIVEGHRNDGDMEEYQHHFRQIRTKYGVYASLGNHESLGRSSKLDFLAASGIRVLADNVAVIDNSFCLVGRKDHRSSRRKPLTELLASIPDNLPVIILDHRPLGLEQVSRHGVDLQVSGHTHNGQIFPLNWVIKMIYQLGWGYKKIRSTHFFVTSGIRGWGPPVRTAGDSEIMLIHIDFLDNE